jgi:carnitine O-palmitoyltransferase 1, liver isoform
MIRYKVVMNCICVQCQDAIERSLLVAQNLLSDVDLRVMMFDDYGKGFIKRCNVSPDAYIQMALQLAYYRVSKVRSAWSNERCLRL